MYYQRVAWSFKHLFDRFGSAGHDAAPDAQMSASEAAVRFGLEAPAELLTLMTGGGEIEPRISRAQALQVPAVLRARNLICGTLSTLPIHHHGPDKRVVPWPLIDHPDPEIPQSVMWALTYEDLLFESVAWWRVTRRDRRGWPVEALHVPHSSVTVSGGPYPPSQAQITPDLPFGRTGQVYIDGIPVDDIDIIRFDSPNPPLLRHGARAIRTGLRLEQATRMYAETPMPLSHFESKEGADPLSMAPGSADDGTDRSEVDAALDAWEAARKKRSTAYIAALTLVKDQWDPKQLQLVEARDQAAKDIAVAAGLNPEDVGVSTTSRTYQNIEQSRQDMKAFTLGAYVQAVQERLSMRDVSPRGFKARIDWGGFLRSDTLTRMQGYDIGLRVGAIVHDEIRDLEDKPALTAEQRAEIRKPAAAAPPSAERTPAMSRSDILTVPDNLAGLRFADEGQPVTLNFNSDEAAATFRVNPERRTVSGLAVPWGAVAVSGYSKWKFAEGSLHWSDDSRVKMNLDHNRGDTVGRGVRLQTTSRGLDTTFQVARGPKGDQALTDAEDGVYDGFSIEIDFASEADGWTADPTDESVRLVHSATLRAVALTAMPAFDDARVERVTASQDQPNTTGKGDAAMGDEPNQNPTAGTVALDAAEFTTFMSGMANQIAESHKNLTEQLGQSIGDSVSAGFKAALEGIGDPQGNGPEPVRAARFTVSREAPVYSFDGRGPSLVRDAWYAQREHDNDAQERIRKFHLQSAEVQKLVASSVAFAAGQTAQFATVTTSSAAEVIPPGYRPDLFVPQLERGRPLVNATSRGTIANATPFVVPVFGSLTGGTGDHTEGSAPTEGTLDFGTKTVTPGAISGKLKLTREIVDSANPAIDQIAMAAMREDYAQQTEKKVYAAVNGADGVGGTITSGFVPSGAQAATVVATAGSEEDLVYALRGALAVYPFRRFAAPNMALLGQNATTLLAGAKDTTGRPLLPSVGAQNASGLGNAVTQGWFIDGLGHIPAWAMTGTAAGDAQVITMNSSDVWAWESPVLAFRFEEKQGPELIELALFGYFATHVLRPVGLSGMRITAA